MVRCQKLVVFVRKTSHFVLFRNRAVLKTSWQISCTEMILWNGTRKNYIIWFLSTSGISSYGISQGKIISVNWLICYRFFLNFSFRFVRSTVRFVKSTVQFVKSTVRFIKSTKCNILRTKTPSTLPFLTFDQKEEEKYVKIGYSRYVSVKKRLIGSLSF